MTEDGPYTVKYVTPVPATPFQRRMALGHAIRLGHEENAVHVSADGILWHKVRLCCGDTIPATVDTFGPPPAVPATAPAEDPARICYAARCGWEFGHAGPCPENTTEGAPFIKGGAPVSTAPGVPKSFPREYKGWIINARNTWGMYTATNYSDGYPQVTADTLAGIKHAVTAAIAEGLKA